MAITLSDLDNAAKADPVRIRPAWRRRPTRAPKATKKATKRLLDDIDDYFTECHDSDREASFCDMAGAAGFDSVTQLVNHARRNGGDTMRGIARGTLAVAAGYEDMVQNGNRSALQMLSMIPHFDSDEPAEQKPQRPFLPQQELNLNITGVERADMRGAELSPQEAYLQLIKYKTYEEISAAIEHRKEKEIEGDYEVVTLDSEAEHGSES